MAGDTVSSVLASLDRHYFPKKLVSLAMQKAPLMSWLPKSEDGKGEYCVIRMFYSNAGGHGSTVAQAKASQTAGGYVKAALDWELLYAEHQIDIPAIKRAEGGGGIVDVLQFGIKSVMQKHGDILEGLLFGDGNGYLGRISSRSGDVVTLTNATDTWNFQPGMQVIVDDTATGASPRTGTPGYLTVESVDHSAGTVTFTDMGHVDSEANDDYLFLKSLENGGTAGGLSKIIPDSAPGGSDDFGGLNRSVAPDELAGWRYTGTSGETVTEIIIKAIRHGSRFGGKADAVFIHDDLYTQLVLEQADRVVYSNVKSEEYSVNFRGVQLQTGDGLTTVLPSLRVRPKRAYVLERDSWQLQSVQEPLIAVATKTGKYQDMESADALLLRWRSQFGLMCSLPGHNGVIIFP